MGEKSEEKEKDELILGLIGAQRFLQVAAMLPALTIGSTLVAPFLGISFGAAGVAVFFFIVVRSLLDRRRLPGQVWMMAGGQVLAAVYVFSQYGVEWAGMLGA